MACKSFGTETQARLGVDGAVDSIGRLLHARLYELQVREVLRDELARRVVVCAVVVVDCNAQSRNLAHYAVRCSPGHDPCQQRAAIASSCLGTVHPPSSALETDECKNACHHT